MRASSKRWFEQGALGFKAFLCESGVEEFPMAREEDLLKAMPILARAGVPLLVHAELEDHFDSHMPRGSRTRNIEGYLDSRPSSWEVDGDSNDDPISRAKPAVARTSCIFRPRKRSRICARRARKASRSRRRPALIIFTSKPRRSPRARPSTNAPLRFANRKIAKNFGEAQGRNPRVRRLRPLPLHRRISSFVKTGDFSKAWGGISGLQFSLPVVWTEMRRRGFRLARSFAPDEREDRVLRGP